MNLHVISQVLKCFVKVLVIEFHEEGLQCWHHEGFYTVAFKILQKILNFSKVLLGLATADVLIPSLCELGFHTWEHGGHDEDDRKNDVMLMDHVDLPSVYFGYILDVFYRFFSACFPFALVC
jgi:hypothetical protein